MRQSHFWSALLVLVMLGATSAVAGPFDSSAVAKFQSCVEREDSTVSAALLREGSYVYVCRETNGTFDVPSKEGVKPIRFFSRLMIKDWRKANDTTAVGTFLRYWENGSDKIDQVTYLVDLKSGEYVVKTQEFTPIDHFTTVTRTSP